MSLKEWKPAQSWGAFALVLVGQIYVAHALGFMVHEYAHSTTAWLMGWKANPLALNYGHVSITNLLAQMDIDENVDYGPIFAAGRGVSAGVIAAAGAVIGNGLISFPISLWGFARARRVGSRTWAMFCYWLCVMSVGNFWDYVPVRTFAPHGDMATVAQGFKCSAWWVLLVLGVPFAAGILYFFVRFAPRAVRWLLPQSRARRSVVVALTAAGFFGYFGMAGASGYGAVSHWISIISACVLFPLVAAAWLWETNRIRATD